MSISAAPSTSSTDALQTHLDVGNKAFALRKYEDAAEAFTVALELYAEKNGDFSPESAPLLLIYGKTLLELAIAQNQVMQQEAAAGGAGGGEEGDEEDEGDDEQDVGSKAELAKNIISELTNISQSDDEPAASGSTSKPPSSSTTVVQLPSPTTAAVLEEGGGDEMEAPEDDFNAAWEVLDTARALFGKMEGGKARLQEADCLITLGDISLETENFAQAVEDFRSALSLKTSLLPSSSRQISEAQLKLGMALEFDPQPESRPLALEHLIKAKETLLLRKEELATGTSSYAVESGSGSGKGKGKGEEVEAGLVNDRVEDLSDEERKAEGKDIEELIQDLDSKIEDLRTAPLPSTTLPDLLPSKAQQTSSPFAPSASSASSSSAPVNDLSSMVKKKKVVPAPAPAPAAVESGEKRKATTTTEEEEEMVKKVKMA